MKNERKSTAQARVCPYEIGFLLDNPIRRLLQSPVKIVGEFIRPNDTVIDLGCGPGYFTIDMAKMVGTGGKVVAVDLQDNMLKQIKRKAAKYDLEDRIEYHRCSSTSFKLKTKADFILAYYVIHETPDPSKSLSELYESLKPGGRLLAVEPKVHVKKDIYHAMILHAKEAGFAVLEQPAGKGGYAVLLAKS